MSKHSNREKDMDEEWRAVSGFEDCYQVSSLGRIRSLDRLTIYPKAKTGFRRKKGKIMKPYLTGRYPSVSLQKDGNIVCKSIHRIVAEVFLESWNSSLEVDHIDNNKKNNNVENLQMLTSSQNGAKAFRDRGTKRGAYEYRGRWKSMIGAHNRVEHLGTYDTKEEAQEIYRIRYLEIHGVEPWS